MVQISATPPTWSASRRRARPRYFARRTVVKRRVDRAHFTARLTRVIRCDRVFFCCGNFGFHHWTCSLLFIVTGFLPVSRNDFGHVWQRCARLSRPLQVLAQMLTMLYRDLPSFHEFSWVLLGFTGFYWVLFGLIGFYWPLLGFTGFYCVLLGLYGFIGFYWVLLGFPRFSWLLLGFTEF